MIHNKYLFYFLSFTWGLPMTLIGCLAASALIATGHKPKKWGYCYHFEVGKSWGGVNLGPVFITSKGASRHTKNHEHGHGFQNCVWGFLFPFTIAIPSATRYWHRKQLVKSGKKKSSELPAYDSVWYEGEATKLGTEFMNWYENNTK